MAPISDPTSTDFTLGESLGKMDAKLDLLVQRAEEDREAQARLADRVQRLEGWRWFLLGASAAIGTGSSILLKVLFHA